MIGSYKKSHFFASGRLGLSSFYYGFYHQIHQDFRSLACWIGPIWHLAVPCRHINKSLKCSGCILKSAVWIWGNKGNMAKAYTFNKMNPIYRPRWKRWAPLNSEKWPNFGRKNPNNRVPRYQRTPSMLKFFFIWMNDNNKNSHFVCFDSYDVLFLSEL